MKPPGTALVLAFALCTAAGQESLQPICARLTNGVQVFLAGTQHCRPGEAAFLVVLAEQWPTGLVPVFAVETGHGLELRRFPARGTEPSAEPLFFGLPRADEQHATSIAGRWSVVATNAHGSRYFPDVDLTSDAERVAGRFNPESEFRVAYIGGGMFRSNRLELHAEYFQDKYTLLAELRNGRLSGTWRHHDDSDRGTWSATRSEAMRLPSEAKIVPLYEWRQGTQRRYGVQPPEGGEWQRQEKPLCRVWAAGDSAR